MENKFKIGDIVICKFNKEKLIIKAFVKFHEELVTATSISNNKIRDLLHLYYYTKDLILLEDWEKLQEYHSDFEDLINDV